MKKSFLSNYIKQFKKHEQKRFLSMTSMWVRQAAIYNFWAQDLTDKLQKRKFPPVASLRGKSLDTDDLRIIEKRSIWSKKWKNCYYFGTLLQWYEQTVLEYAFNSFLTFLMFSNSFCSEETKKQLTADSPLVLKRQIVSQYTCSHVSICVCNRATFSISYREADSYAICTFSLTGSLRNVVSVGLSLYLLVYPKFST